MNTSKQIRKRFIELNVEIEPSEIERRLSDLTERFKVPIAEAERSVISYFLRKHAIERADYYKGAGANQTVTVVDIPDEENKWVNLRVKYVAEWENAHESMQQVGLVADSTGKIKFTLWSSAGLPSMEIDKSYSIENVVTKVWNDQVSITMNKTSVITEIDDDIEVADTTSEYTGVLVSIKNGSGLIKRCKECNRALKNGICLEHGSIDGEHDLRILGVLDDGKSCQDILLGLDATVALWGTTLDDAKNDAVEALDASIVLDRMRTDLVGRYYTVSGSDMGDTLLVKSCEVI
jgi:replication factor A1